MEFRRRSYIDAVRSAASARLTRRLQSGAGPSQYEPTDVADWSTDACRIMISNNNGSVNAHRRHRRAAAAAAAAAEAAGAGHYYNRPGGGGGGVVSSR